MKKLMAFILSCILVFSLAGCGKEAASVGIIGGADGPTAIFVTSNINWMQICGLIGVIGAAGFIIFQIRKKK